MAVTLLLINPSLVVTLGTVALEALKLIEDHTFTLRDHATKIQSWHGRALIPLYHPSPQVLITIRDQKAQIRDYQLVARAIGRMIGDRFTASPPDVR